jgi:hypothetical protein
MMKNEGAIISAKDYGSNKNLTNDLTMDNNTPTRNKFQYHCSFCACQLKDDGLRFNGVGACPACDDLARLWVNSLREHAAHYFNLGVRK